MVGTSSEPCSYTEENRNVLRSDTLCQDNVQKTAWDKQYPLQLKLGEALVGSMLYRRMAIRNWNGITFTGSIFSIKNLHVIEQIETCNDSLR